jgi:hypothetical protein
MTWQIITAANIVVAAAYFGIPYFIASGTVAGPPPERQSEAR